MKASIFKGKGFVKSGERLQKRKKKILKTTMKSGMVVGHVSNSSKCKSEAGLSQI